MPAIAHENLPHVLCGLLLLSRVGDVGTTYLLTPTLALEANPIVRRLGWRFAILTIGACVIPYFSLQIALGALMPFLFVSASNASRVWAVRAMGEQAYEAWLMDLARQSKLSHALLGIAVSSFFIALAGATILIFYPEPEDWGFWIGVGVLVYAAVVPLYGALWTTRLFRRARAPREGA